MMRSISCVIALVVAAACAKPDAGPRELPLLRVEAQDMSFTVPTESPGGLTRVRLVNHGPSWHEALITKLPDGVEPDAYLAAARAGEAFPVGAVDMGGPGKVATGDSSEMVVHLEPGRYVVVCWSDNHVKSGMLSPVLITVGEGEDADSTAVPPATGEVRLVDFRIERDSGTYRAGPNVLTVRNTGQRPHDVTYYRLEEGKTLQDFGAWLATREGPPPAVPVGGMVTLGPGREALMVLNLSPGRYFAGCGTPEQGADGKTTLHFMMGMLEQFEIR
jgi:hypothetical protein